MSASRFHFPAALRGGDASFASCCSRVRTLGATHILAMENGIGIEGLVPAFFLEAGIICTSVQDAVDLLGNPERRKATLRS
jgi:hypothetical protein